MAWKWKAIINEFAYTLHRAWWDWPHLRSCVRAHKSPPSRGWAIFGGYVTVICFRCMRVRKKKKSKTTIIIAPYNQGSSEKKTRFKFVDQTLCHKVGCNIVVKLTRNMMLVPGKETKKKSANFYAKPKYLPFCSIHWARKWAHRKMCDILLDCFKLCYITKRL